MATPFDLRKWPDYYRTDKVIEFAVFGEVVIALTRSDTRKNLAWSVVVCRYIVESNTVLEQCRPIAVGSERNARMVYASCAALMTGIERLRK